MPLRVPSAAEYALLDFDEKTQALADVRDLVNAWLYTEGTT